MMGFVTPKAKAEEWLTESKKKFLKEATIGLAIMGVTYAAINYVVKLQKKITQLEDMIAKTAADLNLLGGELGVNETVIKNLRNELNRTTQVKVNLENKLQRTVKVLESKDREAQDLDFRNNDLIRACKYAEEDLAHLKKVIGAKDIDKDDRPDKGNFKITFPHGGGSVECPAIVNEQVARETKIDFDSEYLLDHPVDIELADQNTQTQTEEELVQEIAQDTLQQILQASLDSLEPDYEEDEESEQEKIAQENADQQLAEQLQQEENELVQAPPNLDDDERIAGELQAQEFATEPRAPDAPPASRTSLQHQKRQRPPKVRPQEELDRVPKRLYDDLESEEAQILTRNNLAMIAHNVGVEPETLTRANAIGSPGFLSTIILGDITEESQCLTSDSELSDTEIISYGNSNIEQPYVSLFERLQQGQDWNTMANLNENDLKTLERFKNYYDDVKKYGYNRATNVVGREEMWAYNQFTKNYHKGEDE